MWLIVIPTVVSVGVLAWLAFYIFWPQRPVKARVGPGDVQQATIVVNGRYKPDRVVVRLGIPVRLNFIRNEDTPCSEWVIFSEFNIRRRLAAFRTTVVDFLPTKPGEFLFTCQLGLYRGKLLVQSE